MRVTEEMIYRMINSNVIQNKDAVYKTQQQIATGRKVNRASDDPSAFEIIGKNHFESANISQYSKNADLAKYRLLNTESVLRSVLDVFHRASELTIKGGDDTMGDRAPLGHEINQLLESLIALANSSESGSYTFAGLRSDNIPYSVERDTNGMITDVTYEGGDKVLQVEIGRGSFVPLNIPGSDPDGSNGVFHTDEVDLFGTLIELRDQLLANENSSDLLGGVNACLDHVINTITIVGARMERIEIQNDMLTARMGSIGDALDKMESLDIAEAMVRLSERQFAYEAAIRASSLLLNQPTLMDYLR